MTAAQSSANTAAEPVIVYRVESKCGRIFGWAATDMHDLFRQLQEKGIEAKRVRTLSEYEAEQEMKQSA